MAMVIDENVHRVLVDGEHGDRCGRGAGGGRCGGTSRALQSKVTAAAVKHLSRERLLGQPDVMGCVFCLRFDPTGDVLAAATADSCISIWDPWRGRVLMSLRGHTEIVSAIEWLHQPDQPTFFSSSVDKSILLWRNYVPVAKLTDHQDWIRCLGVSPDDRMLISGCVSSMVYGWDVITQKVIFKVQNTMNVEFLNTINSLQFASDRNDVFVSGSRDGYIRMWDVRCAERPICRVLAHDSKLNSVEFSQSSQFLLSAGRDSAVRLWDVRKFANATLENSKSINRSALVREYTEHACANYNANAQLFNSERHIIAGSEKHKVFVYDKMSGEVVTTLLDTSPVLHIVQAAPPDRGCVFVSSTTDSNAITVWSPRLGSSYPFLSAPSSPHSPHSVASASTSPISSPTAVSISSSAASILSNSVASSSALSSSAFSSSSLPSLSGSSALPLNTDDMWIASQRSAVETLMHKYGEQILKIFHQYNFTFSQAFDWRALLERVAADSDGNPTERDQVFAMVNHMAHDFLHSLNFHRQQQSVHAIQQAKLLLQASGGASAGQAVDYGQRRTLVASTRERVLCTDFEILHRLLLQKWHNYRAHLLHLRLSSEKQSTTHSNASDINLPLSVSATAALPISLPLLRSSSSLPSPRVTTSSTVVGARSHVCRSDECRSHAHSDSWLPSAAVKRQQRLLQQQLEQQQHDERLAQQRAKQLLFQQQFQQQLQQQLHQQLLMPLSFMERAHASGQPAQLQLVLPSTLAQMGMVAHGEAHAQLQLLLPEHLANAYSYQLTLQQQQHTVGASIIQSATTSRMPPLPTGSASPSAAIAFQFPANVRLSTQVPMHLLQPQSPWQLQPVQHSEESLQARVQPFAPSTQPSLVSLPSVATNSSVAVVAPVPTSIPTLPVSAVPQQQPQPPDTVLYYPSTNAMVETDISGTSTMLFDANSTEPSFDIEVDFSRFDRSPLPQQHQQQHQHQHQQPLLDTSGSLLLDTTDMLQRGMPHEQPQQQYGEVDPQDDELDMQPAQSKSVQQVLELQPSYDDVAFT